VNVNLTTELEKLVRDKVKSGQYESAVDVVSDALRFLGERDQVRQVQTQELRKKRDKGLESLERGEGVDGEEFFDALEREERELTRRRKRA
jgi:antitoxin ParD1/3/4